MTRTLRLTLAAAVVAAVTPALPAFARPDPPDPPCRMHFERDSMIAFSEDFPVQPPVSVPGRPYWVC